MNLEEELRRALRREPAPAHFTAKVMRRTARRRWPLYAVAAGVMFMALVSYQGIEAKRQLMVALKITRTTLRHTQAKVEQAGRHTL